MAAPQQAALPASFILASGMQVILTAVNQSTGALVAGVRISSASISVDDLTGDTSDSLAPNPLLVPSE